MMPTASAAVHAEQAAIQNPAKRPIWQCREPGCNGHRTKDNDGINWTCTTCHVGTNKDKAVETAKPVLVASRPVPRTTTPTPPWMRERLLAGARTLRR